uniref:Huntingtin interacting protein 1 related n=1 Tax=Myotis myotis TaxID=51298 RepID=A0A7J7S1N7_MYOMY|nr:huntingtin interacting protein 1 related [Myotis myotis]
MNSIKNVPARVLSRRPGHSLEAEREQFDKTQAISISKAINTQEAPVKEKHARRIILGTHHEKGAFTFWSYAIGLPLPSSSILSWKFCHVLHKVLRDGHPNVLHDCQRYRSNIREIGELWGHLHDRYGQLVNVYTKLLLTKISFHLKHPQFPAGLEVTDEVLEKAAGTDINDIFQLTVEMFDYMDCELKLSESVFRQLNTAIAVSQMSSGQCRLAPLIQVIQDCSHLYHYTVKLMFRLHSCESHQVKRESEMKLEEQSDQLEKLRRELEAKSGELVRVQQDLSRTEQSGSELSSRLDMLSAEKEALSSAVRQQEADLQAAQSLVQEKEAALSQEQQRHSQERAELQGRLADKESREQGLQQRLLDEQFEVLRRSAAEAERILQDAVGKLDDPLHLRCTSSPDYLVSRAQVALDAVSALETGHAQYLTSRSDASALVAALTQFSHLAADTIINGSATSHLAPTDPADRLIDACRDCGARALELVGQLQDPQAVQQAQPDRVRSPLQAILQLGQELKPKSLDVRQEELGALVDKEMAATSSAIEEAVRRIEDMMNQARHASSGVKLEVNERILKSCTDLMKAIRLLVTTSTSLQKEIVESGRGAATQQEFYAKNSRWTEGLISASKAVGWGATQLVESADKVVLHTGKYEELIVCSHEIAASTAQLVAASKVKANKDSRHLSRLQECSRTVNVMAANVVASTKLGQEQIEERDTMDFSGMSLIKLKKQEMETQVRVLELEKTLEAERVRLGELRKQHYALAVGVGTPAEEEPGLPSAAPHSGTSRKPPLAQKPSVAPRQDHQLDKKDGVCPAQLMNS